MFGFGKKTLVLAAPVPGQLLDITAVADPVFAGKVMGDGFAVEPSPDESVVVAPCDGEVMVVAETGHAVALKSHGVEILIHVGIDTVTMKGEGFATLVKPGDRVKTGTPLLRFDRAVILAAGKPLTTMVVVTNQADVVKKVEKDLSNPAGVMTLTL
ncbi:MAG: PTS glucose transporter subunit IIA [Schwartzia sp.]|nr:PTS glucose transporter subunit IIA [Schwartzia sp. (in: firmicutes)]